MHSIDFHAHHSPQGAYATFTCGRFAAGGGPTIEGVQPASMDLVIGYADGGTDDMHALPFFRGADIPDFSDFATDAATPPRNRRLLLADPERHYQRSVDTWVAGDFSFAIYTPVRALPDPEAVGVERLGPCLLPAVAARLTLTNSSALTRRLVFAITVGRQCRLLVDEVPGAKAVAWGTDLGIA
ncbi:MAG TPA: glycoside hydrolase family 52 protein, partial [Polyangiaceae bacterium]|nr:glycoside hydrolase family 52 protein [Polyangiaceae bacterium]